MIYNSQLFPWNCISTLNSTSSRGSCLARPILKHIAEAASSGIRINSSIFLDMRMSKMPRLQFLSTAVDHILVFGCTLSIVRVHTPIDGCVDGTTECFTGALDRDDVRYKVG